MNRVRTALVVGGGIAGPAAAMALRKIGVEATVCEARPGRADGVGVFLTLGSNGLDALRTLGADTGPLAAGFPTPGILLRSSTGRELGVSAISAAPQDGPVSRTVKRSDLYRAVYGEAAAQGIRFEHGKRLVHAQDTGPSVRALFEDGSEATADLLVGADGVHSTVRRLIDPEAPSPVYGKLLNLGGYARGVKLDADPGSYVMIFGRKAFFGYVLSPDGEVWWFANVPRRDEPARAELEPVSAEAWLHRLKDLFADDAGPAVRILEATSPDDVMRASPLHLLPHLPRWHHGRMVVIGDAAHAPSPSSGQGASLAIEDAVELARCLRDVPDLPLARFEELRRPRVERIIKAAARVNSSKAAGPVGRVFIDAFLPLILRLAAGGEQTRRTYAHHIDWTASAA
ncbi:NAD(P)/FAD-dependent oxidoreductase [Actinocorallia sp. B10E7]|uniref:FAD-dependent oxidoreductase n=1 Tax=Actinocorallia sp. B10E7 TaxID=3153558 RepID=UPI00325F104A